VASGDGAQLARTQANMKEGETLDPKEHKKDIANNVDDGDDESADGGASEPTIIDLTTDDTSLHDRLVGKPSSAYSFKSVKQEED
jgi:hypothetical protein